MPCNNTVHIAQEFIGRVDFDALVVKPVIASMKHAGCTGNKVALNGCVFSCEDEKCFPEKIEPNPQKT